MIYNLFTSLGYDLPSAVPADFAGMHWFQWPYGLSVNPTWLNQKNNFQHDYLAWGCGPTDWAQVEIAPGVYDWSATDAWMDAMYERGISPCVSPLYMPSFYSANPTTLSAASGGYYGCGGPLTAQGRTGWENFVTASITRYKNRGTPIKYWQSWEEPWWPATLGDGYWWGTQGDMVDLSYISYVSAKAADPSIIVLSPSASPPVNSSPADWASHTGTVNSGIYGYDTYDWYGVDLFGDTPTAYPWGVNVDSTPTLSAGVTMSGKRQSTISDAIALVRASMGAHIKPIAVTSFGFGYVGNDLMASTFMALSTSKRKQWIARSLLEFAANGVQLVTVYGGDAWTTIGGGNTRVWAGDYVNDTDGVISGFNEVAAAVSGKTITYCGYLGDGLMTAMFSDGSKYTV